MRKDLDQGRTVVSELLKMVNSSRSTSSTNSPLTTISPIQPVASPTLPTIISTTISERSSSSSFLEKEKEMRELEGQTIIKKNYSFNYATQKSNSFRHL